MLNRQLALIVMRPGLVSGEVPRKLYQIKVRRARLRPALPLGDGLARSGDDHGPIFSELDERLVLSLPSSHDGGGFGKDLDRGDSDDDTNNRKRVHGCC